MVKIGYFSGQATDNGVTRITAVGAITDYDEEGDPVVFGKPSANWSKDRPVGWIEPFQDLQLLPDLGGAMSKPNDELSSLNHVLLHNRD